MVESTTWIGGALVTPGFVLPASGEPASGYPATWIHRGLGWLVSAYHGQRGTGMAISYATVDEYIASFPEDVAARLSQVREIIDRYEPESDAAN